MRTLLIYLNFQHRTVPQCNETRANVVLWYNVLYTSVSNAQLGCHSTDLHQGAEPVHALAHYYLSWALPYQ